MTIQDVKKKTLPILKRQGVIKAGVFGSFVRNEAKKNSDVDFLLKVKKGTTLLDLAGLKIELEEILKRKVHLTEYSTTPPLFKNEILKEQELIYKKKLGGGGE